VPAFICIDLLISRVLKINDADADDADDDDDEMPQRWSTLYSMGCRQA